jgi:hypothetical protein
MTPQQTTASPDAREAAEASDLLVTVASTLNERLAITSEELGRSQTLLKEASNELLMAFRGAADRLVAAQKMDAADRPEKPEYALVLDHLYRAVHHLQSHDLVNQLIDAQKHRVEKMRDKLAEALSAQPHDARAMLDCIIAGIAQIDEEARTIHGDNRRAGSVDLF